MPFNLKGIFFVLVLFYCSSSSCNAQFFDAIETSLREKPKFDFKVDTRHSFISARVAKILGVKVGVSYANTTKFGLGYNYLWSKVKNERTIINSKNERESVNATFKFWYLSPYFEYVFYNEDPWEISILALVGGGTSHFKYQDKYGVNYSTDKSFVLLWEPYMTAQYRVLKYFGVGAGIGYRLPLSGDKFSRRQLISPIYVLKMKVYLQEILEEF